MTTASLNDSGGTRVLADRVVRADRTPDQQSSMRAPLGRCPYWCERPDGHDWEDGAALGDLMRVHRHTFPIPGTDDGSCMVLATECLSRAGIERSPTSYVVDTGLGSDGELDAAGALGLARVLATALALTELDTKPPPHQ